MLLSTTVTGKKSKSLMSNDTCRAYMHARTASDIYVELCEEDKIERRDEQRCGKLVESMHETRAAAHDWQAEVTRTFKELGFKQGKASPCVFWHQRDIKALVHGDDFLSSIERTKLERLWKGLKKKKFETKLIMIGEDDDMAKEARVLNRIVRWHPREGITV